MLSTSNQEVAAVPVFWLAVGTVAWVVGVVGVVGGVVSPDEVPDVRALPAPERLD